MAGKRLSNRLKDLKEDLKPKSRKGSAASSYGPIPSLDIETIRNECFAKAEDANLTGDESTGERDLGAAQVRTRKTSVAAVAARSNHFREGRVDLEPNQIDEINQEAESDEEDEFHHGLEEDEFHHGKEEDEFHPELDSSDADGFHIPGLESSRSESFQLLDLDTEMDEFHIPDWLSPSAKKSKEPSAAEGEHLPTTSSRPDSNLISPRTSVLPRAAAEDRPRPTSMLSRPDSNIVSPRTSLLRRQSTGPSVAGSRLRPTSEFSSAEDQTRPSSMSSTSDYRSHHRTSMSSAAEGRLFRSMSMSPRPESNLISQRISVLRRQSTADDRLRPVSTVSRPDSNLVSPRTSVLPRSTAEEQILRPTSMFSRPDSNLISPRASVVRRQSMGPSFADDLRPVSVVSRPDSNMVSPRASVLPPKPNTWSEEPQRKASEASWRDPFEPPRLKTPPGYVSHTSRNFSRKPSEATWKDPFENSVMPSPGQSYAEWTKEAADRKSYADWSKEATDRKVSVSSVYSQFVPDALKRKVSVWKERRDSRMPDLEENHPYDPDLSSRSDSQATWTDPFEVPAILPPQEISTQAPMRKGRKASYAAWEEDNERAPLTETPHQDLSEKWDHSQLRGRLDEMDDEYSKGSFSSARRPRPYSYYQEPELKYTKVKRAKTSWHGNWSTRQIILIAVGIVITTATALGIGIGLWQNQVNGYTGLTPVWRPSIGSTMQFQIGSVPTNPSRRAIVYDIDLYDNNATTIQLLHSKGRRVICYFSAGAYDKRRPDATQFPAAVLGKALTETPDQQWLDIRQNSVRSVMANRIQYAKNLGCDGVDPDNVDGYADMWTSSGSNVTGFGLTLNDGADYVRYLANQAHGLGLAIGLKNAPELINKTLDVLEWHLNEGCATRKECARFQPFIEAGKPVYHIEYANNATAPVLNLACNAAGTHLFSTMIKRSALDDWAVDCPFGDPTYGSD